MNTVLHDGYYSKNAASEASYSASDLSAAAAALASAQASGLELTLYTKQEWETDNKPTTHGCRNSQTQ